VPYDLAVLRDSGFIVAARVVRYRLTPPKVGALVAALGAAADYR
jgi:hypothetical protein